MVQGVLRELTRAVSWHRRLLAAALAAAAVALVIYALEPEPPPTVTVLGAARDLPGGTQLGEDDLRPLTLPADSVPSGVVRPGAELAQRVLASPLRAGEPLTNVRLLGPALVASYGADLVAAPVRVGDPGAVELLRVGDRVDVLAASTEPASLDRPARTVVRDAPVVALPSDSGRSGIAGADVGGLGGGLIVLAVTPSAAADLARYQVSARLSVVVRPGPAS